MASVELRSVDVLYPVFYAHSQFRLSDLVGAKLLGLGDKDYRPTSHVHALRNVSLRLAEGERLGIVGRNGAGKSTLLKCVAGMCPPRNGLRVVDGDIYCLLDPGIMIDGNKTGAENAEFAGLMFGLGKKHTAALVQDVADFTELGDFMDLPVTAYSDGMRARLAFAIATARQPDVLVIDEGIGAGDAHFVAKARMRLENFLKSTSIMILATHSPGLLLSLCNRAIELEQGRIVADGEPQEVWAHYVGGLDTQTPHIDDLSMIDVSSQ